MPRHVEKLRVPVCVALLGELPVDGALSLDLHAELHDGPETLLERLNVAQRVLPFHREGDQAFALVTRAQIRWVMAGPAVAPEWIRPRAFLTTREERVRVRLLGEDAFEGILAMEMPTDFNRASDFLNGPEDFFPLQTDQGTLLLNKAHVLDVCLIAAARIPRAA